MATIDDTIERARAKRIAEEVLQDITNRLYLMYLLDQFISTAAKTDLEFDSARDALNVLHTLVEVNADAYVEKIKVEHPDLMDAVTSLQAHLHAHTGGVQTSEEELQKVMEEAAHGITKALLK